MFQNTIETPGAAFDISWWETFLERSQRLTKAAVFKNALNNATVSFYERSVLNILRELAKLRTDQYGYRVYIDGKILDAEGMALVYDAPPGVAESFADWVARVFGDKKFGIILNSGEKFDQDLSKDIALNLAPLFGKIGFPREGVQFSIFIGNYDKTPLGIHQDKRGENVMHFHLGPGSKSMHLWEKTKYLELTEQGPYTRHDLEALLPLSEEFRFEQGDVFFMPEGEYHIGRQEGLSMGITVWQYNHTNDLVAKNLHQLIFKQLATTKCELIHGDSNDLEDTSALDGIVEKYKVTSELAHLNYSDLLRTTYKDWRYCIHSNAGYRAPPFPRAERLALDADDEIQVDLPYKLLIKKGESNDKMYIYVRGQKIEFKYFACIESLIEKINEGARHKVGALLQLLDAQWDAKIGLYILGELHRWYGIRKVSA